MPQVTLSLVGDEKEKILGFLNKYQELKAEETHILRRVEIQDCVVTLYSSGKIVIQGNSCLRVSDLIKEYLGGGGESFLGIDETGRGEREGPFVVCGVLGKNEDLRELRDSKKMKDHEAGYNFAMDHIESGLCVSFSPEMIDSLRTKGVNMDRIQAMAVNTIIESFEGINVKVDGSPLNGVDAEFIVKGDDLVPVISAASVIAKHVRNESKKKGTRKTWKC